MGDPLGDPRAARLLAADPGEVAALAGAFRRVASQAQTAAAGLRGARSDATWTGEAASAFRSQVGKLPGDLDQVQRSYGDAAGALDGYEGRLGPIRSAFVSLVGQLQSAQTSLGTAESQLTGAQHGLTTATAAPHASSSTPAVTAAHAAVTAAGGAVGQLQGELSGLQSRGFALLDEFDAARGQARSTISSAAGIAPSQSWLAGALSAVGNLMEGVAVGVGKSVWDLVSGHAIEDFIDHPSWSTFGELAKDVAVSASIVALVAAPFAAPELLEADAAAEGADAAAAGAEGAAGDGASGLGGAARTLSNAGNGVSTGAMGAGALSDAAQGHWTDVGVDVLFAAGPNLGSMPRSLGSVRTFGDGVANILGVGDNAAEAAERTATELRDYQILRDTQINPTGAASLAFTGGMPPAGLAALERDGQLGASVQQARDAAASAATTALKVGRPVAIGFDNVAADPTEEAAKRKLSPAAAHP